MKLIKRNFYADKCVFLFDIIVNEIKSITFAAEFEKELCLYVVEIALKWISIFFLGLYIMSNKKCVCMNRLTYLLACLLISIGFATAQTVKVTGTVTSSEDQLPVIGAAIVVKGTTIGTVSDFEGKFTLDVPRDAKVIYVSYVGLKTKEVAVAPVLNIVLDSDSKALDEVVVTAMGLTREKKSLGYALQEVKSDEITKAGQMNV
ncbi:MAG: carboxypeptidase-like regulatory domain-containing protein, partial [bacterium]|nr:carboxypeptidase-like regulatory domain-containing protein [bacterium]